MFIDLQELEQDISNVIEVLPTALPSTREKLSVMDVLKPTTQIKPGSVIEKTQNIRLLDVFVLGPAMIYTALDVKPPKLLRTFMLAVGAGTILYNLSNYMEQEKAKKV